MLALALDSAHAESYTAEVLNVMRRLLRCRVRNAGGGTQNKFTNGDDQRDRASSIVPYSTIQEQQQLMSGGPQDSFLVKPTTLELVLCRQG